jgi:hypothetical protein
MTPQDEPQRRRFSTWTSSSTTTHKSGGRDSPGKPLAILAGVTCIALALASLGLVWVADVQHDRKIERDRLALDACEQRNQLRQQIIDIAHANEEMVRGILELAGVSEMFFERITPALAEYEQAVGSITLRDCSQ